MGPSWWGTFITNFRQCRWWLRRWAQPLKVLKYRGSLAPPQLNHKPVQIAFSLRGSGLSTRVDMPNVLLYRGTVNIWIRGRRSRHLPERLCDCL